MNVLKAEFPLKMALSFEKLFDTYHNLKNSSNTLVAQRAEAILKIAEANPILTKGISKTTDLEKYKDQIDLVTADLFSSVLEQNEIKFATMPFQQIVLKSTQRYKDIIENTPETYDHSLINFDDDQFYIFGCSLILTTFYDYHIDFRRPFIYKIPDATGLVRAYRVQYNGDYIDVEKTKNAKDITEEDLSELLDNFNNIAVWKEKFPPESWVFKGFVIASLFDVTTDTAISDFKTLLLKQGNKDEILTKDIQSIFQNVFNLPQMLVGFLDFNAEEDTLEELPNKGMHSYILNGKKSQKSSEALCNASYYKLFKQNEFYTISDVERYHKLYPENVLYKKLLDQDIKSAIIAAVVDDKEVLGVLELASKFPQRLNSINAIKLKDIMPFLEEAVIRAKAERENELELIIQEECTSIHSSVHWKFRREAKRYLKSMTSNNPTYFREIIFEDVYPLYGQMDIKGSSEARNNATVLDLRLQLDTIQSIIKRIYNVEKLPIYEQINYRITEYLKELEKELQVDSERQVLNFLQAEIVPLFVHLGKKNTELEKLIDEYYEEVDKSTGLIYKHRKYYDETVMFINKRMASVLDKKQMNAQEMYPHYYERYKTDGVEHNLYIGESITKDKSFHKVYLYNLRLWQLQAMWEMENQYYRIKKHMSVELDVASMILVFNGSLSLRFRMDEKRFDVDGTYNARYEVVKKRVDKSLIKGTDERVTQAGKLTIIYSQDEDETEYKKYISFLQTNQKLEDDLEMLELEDLQGVTGLRAMRVSVLYSKGKENNKEYYTYEDLIEQINE